MFDSIHTARQSVTVLRDNLEPPNAHIETDVSSLITALQQVIDIAEAVEVQDQLFTPGEITDIGERALTLIHELIQKMDTQQLDLQKRELEQVALVIAQWVIIHHGALTTIQPIVDGLAYLANTIQHETVLAQLARFMGEVMHACSDIIKHDLDIANETRPWRILNINRGIVATRSHDLELMRSVFAELIQAIPLDAPQFFREGLTEMVRLDYPDPVRELMQEFYERTEMPAVH